MAWPAGSLFLTHNHSHVFFIPYNRRLKVEVSVNIIIGIWGGLWKERSRSRRARAWERGKQGLRDCHPLHLLTVVPGGMSSFWKLGQVCTSSQDTNTAFRFYWLFYQKQGYVKALYQTSRTRSPRSTINKEMQSSFGPEVTGHVYCYVVLSENTVLVKMPSLSTLLLCRPHSSKVRAESKSLDVSD